MNKAVIISLIFLTSLLSACQKDLDTFVPDPGQIVGPDTTWYSNVPAGMPVNALRTSLLLPLHNDSLQLTNGAAYTTITTGSGIRCTFPANCLVASNNVVASQNIQLENLLVKKKGDMIRMEVPTTSYQQVIVSEGAILLRARKDTTELRLAQGTRLTINYPVPLPVVPANLFFNETFSGNGFNWTENTDSVFNSLTSNSEGYTITSNKLNWMCMANVYNTAADVTRLTTGLPNHYTNANTIVYLVFNNIKAVVKLKPDVDTHQFKSIPVPADQSVTMVVLSKQGDDYYLGHKEFTTATTSGQNITNIVVTPARTTFDNVRQYLDAL